MPCFQISQTSALQKMEMNPRKADSHIDNSQVDIFFVFFLFCLVGGKVLVTNNHQSCCFFLSVEGVWYLIIAILPNLVFLGTDGFVGERR